jgi:nicotinate-nucleotide adenylyltransferase
MTGPAREAASTPRVGIFGGTFNPIHVGHLRAAEEVAEQLELERVVFVPSAEPPHKAGGAYDPLAPARHRLAWARLAVEDNPLFEVDPLEVERGGTSYSVDTLRSLGERIAPQRPVFLIGCDAFALLGTWKDPQTLLTLAHFAVTTRPPVSSGRLGDWLPACVRDDVVIEPDGRSGRHRRAGTWLRVVEISALDVSSSDIRSRLRDGRSVRYLLPEAVRKAVLESGAYDGR